MNTNVLSILSSYALALPRFCKQILVALSDLTLCVAATFIAFYLRLGEFTHYSSALLLSAGYSVVLMVPVFKAFGLYRAVFRHQGSSVIRVIASAVSVYGALFAVSVTVIGLTGVPRTIGLIQPMMLFILISCSRSLAKLILVDWPERRAGHRVQKALIYGAGEAGRQLVTALNAAGSLNVVAFLDDDKSLTKMTVLGLNVHDPAHVRDVIKNLRVEVVLLAMPKLERKRRDEILKLMGSLGVSVRSIPSFSELVSGRLKPADLTEINVNELLGRPALVPSTTLLSDYVFSENVMVTGAGGSIGSEIAKQVFRLAPANLILVDHSEFALYTIIETLSREPKTSETKIIPLLASVGDKERMSEIMSAWSPKRIYHAAAYKHVPIVEENPFEGIKNNLLGTLSLAELAKKYGVSSFVLVSTDKAVRPTNIMGATKRLAEMVLQAFSDSNCPTLFSIVRFGNVLDSSGSVIPKFREQIRSGGPITVTHPDVTRFFMTIPEAAALVIQAGVLSEGGDIFILDIGQTIKIVDLAKNLIQFSGLTLRDDAHPQGDIEIQFTGLRAGEKLFEEMLIGDNLTVTAHPQILRAREEYMPWENLKNEISVIENCVRESDIVELRTVLSRIVNGYVPNKQIVDWTYISCQG